jgi:hypothetical protein
MAVTETMTISAASIGVLAALLVGCSAQQASSSPSASLTGVEGLVADLATASAPVRQADTFDPTPLSGQGVLLCIGHEEVRVYVFATQGARLTAAGSIEPTDPSHVGTSIVEWTGNPRFWQRDRILVLYLGADASTDALLTSILGPPFARGLGGALGGPRVSAC